MDKNINTERMATAGTDWLAYLVQVGEAINRLSEQGDALTGRNILSEDELLHWHRSDDFLDGVVEVINDYDMSGKVEDVLYGGEYVTGNNFDEHLRDNDVVTSGSFEGELESCDVAYNYQVEDMLTEDDVRDTVDAILFDRKLKEAEASDAELFDIHMKNIGRKAVAEYKAEQEKLKEEQAETDNRMAALPPLPETTS